MEPVRAKILNVIDALRASYGSPEPPPVTDPLGLILWENVVYLADDERRATAFALLQTTVGTQPQQILDAPDEDLLAVTKFGIMPELRVERLRAIAQTALDAFGGNLDEVVTRPLPKAKQGLKKFPSIGDPSAEKILLFARRHPFLAPDSNALRVLVRLGYGKDEPNYAKSYRSALEAVEPEMPTDYDWLIDAHLLLRKHGQELCKRSAPLCESCPVKDVCAYAKSGGV